MGIDPMSLEIKTMVLLLDAATDAVVSFGGTHCAPLCVGKRLSMPISKMVKKMKFLMTIPIEFNFRNRSYIEKLNIFLFIILTAFNSYIIFREHLTIAFLFFFTTFLFFIFWKRWIIIKK